MTAHMRFLWVLFVLPFQLYAQSPSDISRWEDQSQRVQIIRDQWGIPHIYGKSDADAVFGLLYAQCEDDFNRVERNYIEKLGRMAELKGKESLYEDLLIRLVLDSADAIRDYRHAPSWLKQLCNAFADGINFYLYKHPEVKPALLQHFQPWYPLLWTDGSIGAISTADISLQELQALYGDGNAFARKAVPLDEQSTGSNGFAIGPSITASGHSMLYINPHVSFYFRPEVHMVSEAGLNAYGAVTWGQFFVYQGFNSFCGWMHTSSYTDAADTYIESMHRTNNRWTYSYEGREKPVKEKLIRLRYKEGSGSGATQVTAYFTHHGPVMAKRDGKFISMKADNRLMNGLIQCWQRTKAGSFAAFQKTLDLKGNISNNTVYADAAGNIAYWHGNRIPKRNPAFNWNKPVDGSTKATEWQGYHSINETVHLINPPNGWLQNCNSTPFTVAGANSPDARQYPSYMAPDGENFRGINAVRVLNAEKAFTIDKLIKAGYNTKLAAFEVLIPALVKSFDGVSPADTLFAYLAGPMAVLRNWDFYSSESSIATTLAVEWGQRILPAIFQAHQVEDEELDQVAKTKWFAANAAPNELLQPLLATILDLQKTFGRWQLPWGSINRFQRISPSIDLQFDDARPSLPVGFTSSTWGELPAYASKSFPGTRNRYGVHGNSFICAVEFGPRIKAKSLLAGGESGHSDAPNFADQSAMYARGEFKDVNYYKEDVLKHAVKTYHPGE